ncbi:bifunctional ADP-dependent NAD(P)H-hydrate dehydratase/NAD(P)H-hydrate epimerase [Halobacteriales archaeon SW_7_68_16]|nr:MAG: bifunctional ADP-dependent NAD(P)H-hydrate dehydratase/NAD(P)H-hydrate epimerase [Halobacteriales archaeon SW_7_68_16]
MITSDRMAAVDRNAAALGVPRKQLMESSGNAVARVVRDLVAPNDAVVAVAGRGNNGGDALVAARFLDEFDPTVLLVGRPESIRTEIARENWATLRAAGIDARAITHPAAAEEPIAAADVVIDGLLGTGVAGAIREPTASVARAIDAVDATVVSVDVPSGVDPDTGEAATDAVDADHVVTFHEKTPGLSAVDATVTVADIGIPAAAERVVGPGDLLALDRDPRSHKGDHGTVLVVGGGPSAGAPALAAQATLRAGADLAYVATPESVAGAVQGYSEDLIGHALSGDRVTEASAAAALSLADDVDADAVVLGPGLGDADDTRDAIRAFLREFDGRAVIDADALSAVDVGTDATLLCTPHAGELRGMSGPDVDGVDDRAGAVAEFAAEIGHAILLTGPTDVISDEKRTRTNRTGTPAMTVGGTGDVLAGVAGGLLARLPPIEAGAIGAYVTGLAGKRAAGGEATGLVASDLLAELPDAFRTE